ncbi:MAG: septum site-determining protein MinC [Rubrivivax sp.]
MTVVSSEIATAVLELRSAALTLIAVVLKTADLETLSAELDRRATVMPGVFEDEPVAIDLSQVRQAEEPVRFTELIALLRLHRMVPVAARGGSPEQMAAAFAAGLVEAPEGLRVPRTPGAGTQVERIVEVQLPAPPPMIIERPLRSGQQVYARGCDLIVLALVSHGAEVIADGHIHVYAPLRGRAIAGAKGDTAARIFSTAMEAQLLSIAGVYRTTDVPLPTEVVGRCAMVRLAGDSLRVEPLEWRP